MTNAVTDAGADNAATHQGSLAWLEWNDQSFRLARDLDRPILLDISAVWCHWCHVMDQTSYADRTVIDLINRRFVPIRVDNDRRPDINERYNMGGWPTTAFLTPDGDILTGATYVAPDQMRRLLVQVADYYQRNKQDIASRTHNLRLPLAATAADSGGELDPGIVSDVLAAVSDVFDAEHGGFGQQPKFPHPDAIELALRSGSPTLEIATTTLDAMAAGGIHDRVEGGFFRYSVTRDWSIPHFEKMLEGNAGLLNNYVRAYQVTQQQRYAAAARDIVRYVTAVLSDKEQGGFYGSQDADEHYYTLALAERRRRPAPYVDKTLYVDWNAIMVSSCLLAAAVLGDIQMQEFALHTIDRLWSICRHPDGGMCHYFDGEAHLPGLLSDQVHMGMALLDAYQASGQSSHLDRASDLADFCLSSLADAGGGFMDTVSRPNAPGRVKTPVVPMPANALAARFFLRLSWLGDARGLGEVAQHTLARFASGYRRFGYFAAPYALAVDEATRPPLKIVILGDATDPRVAELHTTARCLAEPWKLIQAIDPLRQPAAFAQSGYPMPDHPLAYPCVGTTCLAPLSDPAELAAWGQTAGRST